MLDTGPSHQTLRTLARVMLALVLVAGGLTGAYGAAQVVVGAAPLGLGFLAGGTLLALVGVLLYCQVALLAKFVSYARRSYEALLAAAELQRRQEEHTRTIADNSGLSEWAKRVVYREKDFEFLRDSIQGAIVRQDWESAEHLIRDVDAQFGYHDEAERFRAQLAQAQRSTAEERLSAFLQRFEKLCADRKWDQARRDCERLRALFPEDERIARLPQEIDVRRQEVKTQLLKEYDQAVKIQDIEKAHRLLFALDQYIVPKEAEALKESAREVFRARLEQIKTRFSIAVSYKQWSNALAAGEQVLHEFPHSGYAQEISKLMPVLRERALREREKPAHATAGTGQAQ